MSLKKVVIPVAGKGTRFLPASKEVPKELLPILNVPMIQYVVEEAVQADIEQILFVISKGKEVLKSYFSPNAELEAFLEQNKKLEHLERVRALAKMADIQTVYQDQQLGLGHALLCAKDWVGNENFGVLLGDDLVLGDQPCIGQLIEVSQKFKNCSVIGVMPVDPEQTSQYGIVDGKMLADGRTMLMSRMVEKPKSSEAPSRYATPGRYVLTPAIFEMLERIPRGAGGEYQLTDAINLLVKEEPTYAYLFDGDRFDTGNVRGYLEATLEFSLRCPELKTHAIELMQKKLKEHQ